MDLPFRGLRRRRCLYLGLLLTAGACSGAPSDLVARESAGEGDTTKASAPLTFDEQWALLQADSAKPHFDGTMHGWRIATEQTLEAAGLPARSSSYDCAHQDSLDVPSPFDVRLAYLPPQVDEARIEPADRHICSDGPRSFTRRYSADTAFGPHTMVVSRLTRSQRAFPVEAADDRVTAGVIKGLPAILVRPIDPDLGYGSSEIILIEDNLLDPYATVIRIGAMDLPWSEVLAVANGIEVLPMNAEPRASKVQQ